MDIFISDLPRAQRYKLMVGAVVPRPIAWITSRSPEGLVNAAPYSAFTIASVSPPMLLVNCSRRDGAEKDTARNIQATGDFVINVSTEGQLDLMHSCSAELGPEVSETERFAIALAPSRIVSAPRVADAPVSFECRLHRMIEVGDERNQLIIGEVVHAHVDPAVLNGDKIDQARLRPIGRIGGPTYTALGELFHRPALSGQLADLARLKQAGGNR